MLRKMCRAKIHRATVTGSHLHYEGSIELDEALLEAAGLLEYESVLIANVANGERFETYVIKGPRNSGVVRLNGAAARKGNTGDRLIIMSFAWMDEKELREFIPQFVLVDERNRITEVRSGVNYEENKRKQAIDTALRQGRV